MVAMHCAPDPPDFRLSPQPASPQNDDGTVVASMDPAPSDGQPNITGAPHFSVIG